MRISVITTVLNEEANINLLLDSLTKQTKQADEIVIVDGGSKDGTQEIIKEYSKKHNIIRMIVKKGNIAAGRNVAIKKAKYSIIAQIDAGCIADNEWLKKITDPLIEDKKIGLSAGFYIMTGDSALQKAVAPFHGVTQRRFDPRCFLPSGRSVAFRKSTWKAVGGYSETLQWAGEDTLFNFKVVKLGIKIARVPKAFVYWEVPKTYKETMKKFYKYALGDAQTGIWWHPGKNLSTHNIKIASIFLRYAVVIFLAISSVYYSYFSLALIAYLVFYISYSIVKLLDDVHELVPRLLIPAIQISSDIAIMLGFSVGVWKNKLG